MKDPIKIIHKFKNNNRRIQYKVYIYIGSLVPKDILKILESMTEKDLYTTLNTLSKNEYSELEKLYGEYWYEKFFISYHINSQRNIINSTSAKKKSIESKYGKEWYNKHISEPPVKKVSYSFSASYYNYLLMRNKIKTQTRKVEMDFRTYGDIDKPTSSSLLLRENEEPDIKESENTDNEQTGGKEDSDVDTDEQSTNENNETKEDDDEDETQVISEEDFEEQVEEDFDLDEITKLYTTADVESSKSIIETSKLISEAINDKKWEKSTENLEKKYDDTQEELTYDAKLEDIYKKYYVTEQYIFKDDTLENQFVFYLKHNISGLNMNLKINKI